MPPRKPKLPRGRPPEPLGATRDGPRLAMRLDADAEAALERIRDAEDLSISAAIKAALVAYAKRLGAHEYAQTVAAVERRRLAGTAGPRRSKNPNKIAKKAEKSGF